MIKSLDTKLAEVKTNPQARAGDGTNPGFPLN
jgi:hypothetical protein